MSSGSKKSSWRGRGTQQANRPPVKTNGLRKRRWTSTLILAVLLVAFGFIALQWFGYRDPKTYLISIVGNQGQSQGHSLDNLSIPPLRFAQVFPSKVEDLKNAKNVSVEAPFSLDLVPLTEKVASIAKSSRANDTLLCSIQSQCISTNGRPYLIPANFLLPEAMATLGTFEGAIDVTDLLKVFAPFRGTIIIALDAGDVVADAEVYCEKNDFLLLLKNVVEKEVNNERLWVLTSHSPSEISQDDIVSGHRLFDNALAESLLGAVRLPKAEETKLIWANDRILTLDELANYVHRRVYVDSSKKQSPWLLRGGTGVVRSDKSNWPEATKIRIANLNRDGSIVGLAPKPQKVDPPNTSPSEPPSSEDGPQSPLKSTQDQPEKLTENVRKLSDDIWVNRWKVFEESWEKPAMPNQKQAWAFAECYPAAYREARGKLMNDELRSRAGIETSTTRVDPEIPPLNVDDLERFKSLFEPGTKGKRLDPLELKEAQNKAVIVQSICRASLSVAEARQLRLRLNALNETFRPQLLRLIQSFTAAANQPLDRNTLSKSSLNQLPSQLELQRELESIVDEATRISTNKPALLESLLLCGIINADQRQKVLQAKQQLVKSASKLEYPTSLPEYPSKWNETPTSPVKRLPRAAHTTSVASTPGDRTDSQEKAIVELSELLQEALTDDRRIASVRQTDTQHSRLALLPDPPKIQSGWGHEWYIEGAQSKLLETSRVRLDRNELRLSLKIDPIPKPSEIQLRCSNLDAAIVGIKINGERLKLPNPELSIPWTVFEKNESQVLLELETNPGEKPRDEKLVFSISGLNGPATEVIELPVHIVGAERIALQVKRWTSLDNREQWVDESPKLSGIGFSLQPFAGHETTFALGIENQSEKSRSMKAELYALPSRQGIPGRLFWKNQFIDQEFEKKDFIRKTKRSAPIATSRLLELTPGKSGQLRFDADTKADVATKSEPVEAAAQVKATLPASGTDASGGILATVFDVNDLTFSEDFFLEYLPIEPAQYIEASVQVVGAKESRMIEIYPKYRDENGDTFPDMAPTDLQVLDVGVFLQPWMGSPPKGELRIKLDPKLPKPAKIAFEVPDESLKREDPFIGVDIQGYPRALSKKISLLDLDVHRLESYKTNSPQGEIRSVSDSQKMFSVSPSLVPVSGKPLGTDIRIEANTPLIFQSPQEVTVSVAIDRANDLELGDTQFATVQLGNAQKTIYGDRYWTFQITKANDEGFTVAAKAADHSLSFDTTGISNQKVPLKVDLTDGASIDEIEVIFDSTDPKISGLRMTKEPTYKGDQGEVEFQIDEDGLSGFSGFQLVVADRNGDEKKEPARKFSSKRVERDSQVLTDRFQTDKLEPGIYKLFATTTDMAGNGPSRSSPISFQIRQRPDPKTVPVTGEPSTKVLGTIRGTVKFGGGDPVADGTVSLDLTGKTVDIKQGKFQFNEVPLGKFKLKAESEYQGRKYVGEVPGEFKQEKDFTEPIAITVKK